MVDIEEVWDLHSHHDSVENSTILQLTDKNMSANPRFFSFGIHPMHASEYDESQLAFFFRQVQKKSGFLAVGEIGLDTRYTNITEQEACFVSQLKIAHELKKPVILHCVNSWQRCQFLHQKFTPNTSLIYHGFNKVSQLDTVLSYPKSMLSIGASVHSNQQLQEQLATVPLERIFIETDTSKESIIETYQLIAQIKGLTLRQLIQQIHQNIQTIFKL